MKHIPLGIVFILITTVVGIFLSILVNPLVLLAMIVINILITLDPTFWKTA